MRAGNNKTEYWKIAAGQGGYIWPEQRDSGVTSVGWSNLGNLERFKNNERLFSKSFKQKWPEESPKQLWAFYKNVNKGDKVIACAGSKILGYGKIVGKYKFRSDLHYSHCRNVEWEKILWEPLEAGKLSLPDVIKSLFQKRVYKKTVLNLGVKKLFGEDVFEKIKNAIHAHPHGIENLVEWEGLANAPTSEQETIVLFSKMSPILRMKIFSVGTRYPDALIRVKQRKSWVTKTAEFEFRASRFEDHEHRYRNGDCCDMIICWENDWARNPRWLRNTTQIIELKNELEKII